MVAVASVLAGQVAEARAGICFAPTSNAGLRFPVIRFAPPPPATGTALQNYSYFPISTSATQDLDRLSKSAGAATDQYMLLWANRCHGNPNANGRCGGSLKGNPIYPRLMLGTSEVRAYFSSVARADGCTLTQAAHALGYSATEVARWSQARGFAIAATRTEALSKVVGGKLTDVCVLPQGRLPDHALGIMLDYEVQDRRLASEATSFAKALVSLVHGKGKRAILYTNPLDGPGSPKNGITSANANLLHRIFDAMTVLLWAGNAQGSVELSADRQLDILAAGGPVDRSRLIATFELNGTTLADARLVNTMMLGREFQSLLLWHNLAPAGGACDTETNRKIACAVFGRCS